MLLGMVDPITLGINLAIIIGAVILAVVVVIVIIVAWTGTNIAIWKRQQQHAGRKARGERYQPDGRAYPPAGRGLCDVCTRACEKVYYLPDGRRLCPTCFERQLKESS